MTNEDANIARAAAALDDHCVRRDALVEVIRDAVDPYVDGRFDARDCASDTADALIEAGLRLPSTLHPAETLASAVIAALRKEIADSCPSEFDDEGQKGWVRGLRRALALAEAIAVASQTAPVDSEIAHLTVALAEAERRGAERMRERAAALVAASSETVNLRTGERYLEGRPEGNLTGSAFVDAIRALPLREAGDEA